ncbi:FtsX-like permease family protein [Kibdelosporangium philippinense]|uniref:FtsX-like permease family protein n=1 Tax=Kibdelosporangium philippinense TaxID=211113 RepID=A0ABS8Z7J1_9PSEU|nr:FtsX-like permease family protein [Kibdelosporangium philippinense]MCE7003856.1 FtsX-like permease family protein [Kibdelosporangium philippinense]
MLRMAVRSILANKVRFLLPVLAVMIGVAFVVGSLLYGSSVQKALDGVQPDYSVRIEVRQDVEAGITPDVMAKLRNVAGAKEVVPVAEGPAFVVDKKGALVGPPYYASGVTFDPVNYKLTSGQTPNGVNEVALDDWTAQRTGYKVGDQVRIVVAGVAKTVNVAGIFSASDQRITQGGTLTAFDDKSARAVFGKTPDSYTAVKFIAAPGTSESTLAANVEAIAPQDDYIYDTASETIKLTSDSKITEILLSFAGIALFVSIFLVANTFTMLAAARSREHALLRAVGAERRYVLRMVLAEAVVLGLIATVLGYLLGIGVGASLGSLFTVNDGPPMALEVFGVGPVLAALGVGIGVTILAAYIPARRAAAVPPIAALRTGLAPTSKSLRRRNIAGFVVTALGVLATIAATESQDLIYLGAPLLLIGLIILTPLFGVGLAAVLRGPMTRIAGVRGTLAVENTRRNPRRTGTTAGALIIGLAICAAVTVPVASLRAEEAKRADTGDSADVRISAVDFYAKIGKDTATQVATVPDVQAVTPIIGVPVGPENDQVSAAGVDAAKVSQFFSFPVTSGSLNNLADGIAVSSKEAQAHNWVVGSVVPGKTALPVVAIFTAPEGFAYGALVGASQADADATPSAILIKTAAGKAESVQAGIRTLLDNPTLVVQTKAEYVASAGADLDVFLNILYALLSLSILIGALAVVNTMTMSTLERIREIGLLRAVGLGRGQVGTILRLESVIIAVLGAIAGLAAGCVIGAAAVDSLGGSTAVVLPWDRLGLFVALTVAIGIVAALWPAWKASRVPILQAIHSDTE